MDDSAPRSRSRRNFLIVAGSLLVGGIGLAYKRFGEMGIEEASNPPMISPSVVDGATTSARVKNTGASTIFKKDTTITTTSSTTTTSTTLEEEIYHDASSVGTYTSGDRVYIPEYDIRGIIENGKIEDGKVTSSLLYVLNEQGQTILRYRQMDHFELGHLELISYPQRGEKGEVYIKIDGRDSGCVFPYGFTLDDYLVNLQNENFCN